MEPVANGGACLRVAVVGVGGMAHWQHLPNLRSMADQAKIVAMVDVNAEHLQRAASAYGVNATFTTVGELLRARLDLDAALVVTRAEQHAEPAIELMRARVPVFCEKPLAYRLDQAEEIVRVAEETGVVFTVGYNRRFAATVCAAKEVVAFDKPQMILAEKSKPTQPSSAPWLLEAPIHALDTLRWLAGGEIAGVQVAVGSDASGRKHSVSALIQFQDGPVGVFASNTGGAKWVERFEVFAATATAIVEYPVRVRRFVREERPLPDALASQLNSVPPEREIGFRDGEPILQLEGTLYPVDEFAALGFRAELLHFLTCVRSGSAPLVSGADALATQRLAQRIYEEAGLAQ
jgi:virulence factor